MSCITSLNFAYFLCNRPCEYFEDNFPKYLTHEHGQKTSYTAADRALLTRTRTMPQSGSWSIGDVSEDVYVYVNVSNVYLRLYDLVCIFAPCPEGECDEKRADEELTGCVARGTCIVVTAEFVRSAAEWEPLTPSAQFVQEAEFACEAPPLAAGKFRIQFSSNKMVTDDPSSLAVISNRGWALPDDTGDSMSDDVRVAATRRESIGYATSFGWTTLISKACPTGYVASSARVSCTPCPPGQVANRAGTSCEEWCVTFWHQ